MLLKNNQIRPGISSGIVGERVVRKPESAYKVRTAHHLHAYKGAGGIHHPLRGYESDNSTLMYGVKRLQKEVIVNSLS